MRLLTTLGLTLAVAIAPSDATQDTTTRPTTTTTTTTDLRVVQHEIHRRRVANPIERDRRRLARRQTRTVNAVLDNEALLYYVNVTIGTPSQSLRLHIDTGSSDLWVNTPSSRICRTDGGSLCKDSGTFSPNSSSTYSYVNSLFQIQYADGSSATGDYVRDNVGVGGSTVNALQFAVGYTSSSAEGVLGIGYVTNEAILANAHQTSYSNLPQKMLEQGLIRTNAYSLWLNDLDASTGSILFGGVNTEKFKGSLSTLPIIQRGGVYSAFYIALTAVGMDGNAGSVSNNTRTAVLLDSGSSLTYVPNDVAAGIYGQLGLTYDSSQGATLIDCSRASESRTVDFTFSGVTISVDMSELVVTVAVSRSGREQCIFGINPADGATPVLGDTFLRSAYVVYHLGNNQIALAQTNFNSTTDNVVEITNSTSTSNGIPNASGVANAVSSVPVVPSGGARIGTGTTVTSEAGAVPTAVLGRGGGALGAMSLALAAGAAVVAGL